MRQPRVLHRISSIALMALAVGASTTAGNVRGADSGRKPNIVYCIIDELGYYELSCMGHPVMKTPHIDRMASEGIRFTQFLAGDAVCAPTRCCLQTGKHSGHSSLRTNAGWESIRAEEETLGSMLKRAGYACGGFGKWGCGARGTDGVPETHGYDVFFGYYDQVHAHTYFPRYLIRNSQEAPLEGNTGDSAGGKTFSQYRIFEEARRFLREHKDQPFFLYLPWTPPHGQWGIPKDDPSWLLYKDASWQSAQESKDNAKVYAAMVNLIDRELGEILALLEELKLDENTIVFFSGDNGGLAYFADPEHPAGLFGPNVDPKTGRRFRGGKGNLYEGGLRVPFIVRWPGKIQPGRVSHHLGYFPDIMPTLAELAGAQCPKDTDGLSIVPELLGDKAGRQQEQHEYLYWEFGKQTAVRANDWKAVRPQPDAAWELYDLARDTEEQQDVASAHRDILDKMVRMAEDAHQPMVGGQVRDQTLVDKDRTVPLGRPYPPEPAAKPKGKGKAGKGKAAPASADAKASSDKTGSKPRSKSPKARKPKAERERPMTPGGKWRAGDMNRPRPPVIDPGAPGVFDRPGQPPSDAVVLFDGKDLSHWTCQRRIGREKKASPVAWKAEKGYLEIVPGSGSLLSKEKFGDCQIHLEWATPSVVTGSGQGRGNSGVLLSGYGEIQVLDSCGNDTYPDGQAGALYGKYPPMVNASRRPGQWQTYDIVFESPRVDAQEKIVRPARITVLHNGIVVHHAIETGGSARETQLSLQDHRNPVRYRNIWVRPLKGYDVGAPQGAAPSKPPRS